MLERVLMPGGPVSRRRNRRAIVAAVISACAPLWHCSESVTTGRPDGTYALEITGQYGWAELGDSTRPLSDVERRYEGAVLGNPTGIAVGRSGRLFVLDAGFNKVVIFSPEGEFIGLMTGGGGEGPGEFQFPNQIVVGPGGDLWISDLQLQRISRFSQNGGLVASIPVPAEVAPRMQTITATDSMLYAVRQARDSVPTLIALDSAGAVRGELVWPTSEDVRFGGTRLAIAAGRGRGGSLVVAHTDVGMWSRVEGLSQTGRRGQSLFPEAHPWTEVDPHYGVRTTEVAAQPSHAGGFSDGTVFVRFLETGTEMGGFKLALFDSTGVLLSVLDSVGFGGAFGHSVREKTVYFVKNSPFPRVYRAELVSTEVH